MSRSQSSPEQLKSIAEHFRAIMETLGLDLEDPSLSGTPDRVAKMYLNEVFSGLDKKNFPKMQFFPVDSNADHPLVTVSATFVSFCEHHFVPFKGTAKIAYRPKQKLIGLSKIPRLIRYFARRPQIQERLTSQIADSLSELLETEDIAVCITASHFCVLARGAEDAESYMTTKTLRGKFSHDSTLRQEFFESLRQRS